MELKVEGLDGSLPPKCFIGIRSGGVQKQAPYDPKTLYKFPEAKRLSKIDIYQRIGVCELAWNSEDHETRVCKALDSTKRDTGVRLRVSMNRVALCSTKDSSPAKAVPAKAPEAPVKNYKAESAAQSAKYLSEHRVEEMLTAAMRALLKQTPDDAPAFLCDFVASNYGLAKDAATTWPGSLLPKVNEPVATVEADLSTPSMPKSNFTVPALPEPKVVEHCNGATSAMQAKAAAKDDLATTRSNMANCFLRAFEDGTLEKALSGDSMNTPSPAAPAASKQVVDITAIRSKMAGCLVSAVKDGTLETSLTELLVNESSSAAPAVATQDGKVRAVPAEIDDERARIMQCMKEKMASLQSEGNPHGVAQIQKLLEYHMAEAKTTSNIEAGNLHGIAPSENGGPPPEVLAQVKTAQKRYQAKASVGTWHRKPLGYFKPSSGPLPEVIERMKSPERQLQAKASVATWIRRPHNEVVKPSFDA